MWTPSATQEWLDNDATNATGAVTRLIGCKTTGKIIVESVSRGSVGVCVQGHLFSDQRVGLSGEDRVALAPQQQQYDSANDRLASLQSQLQQLNSAYTIARLRQGQTYNNAQVGPSAPELAGQIVQVQSEIAGAQSQVDSAGAALSSQQGQLLSGDRQHMRVWGQITVNSPNEDLLRKLPGSIVTMSVRVTRLSISVFRQPDGAGWEYSSDDQDQGQTRMPVQPDGAGSPPPGVEVSSSLSCDDLAPYTPPVQQTDSAELASASAPPVVPVRSAGYVTSPRDEDAMTGAVGFVVVGFQAVLPNGQLLQRWISSGSCFAVTPSGYLLTNQHVVGDLDLLNNPDFQDSMRQRWNADIEPHIWVFFGGEKYNASVPYISPKYDMAVLHIARRGQVYFRLAQRDREARGSEVYAAGFPGLGSKALGDKELVQELTADGAMDPGTDIKSQFKERDFEYTLTQGVVSRIVSDASGEAWIQHEALIRHGNSGGPLIAESGVVLGINTRKQTNDDGDVQTNMSQDISQFREELDLHIPGLVWAEP
jgi:S1-C subfamily serine protease